MEAVSRQIIETGGSAQAHSEPQTGNFFEFDLHPMKKVSNSKIVSRTGGMSVLKNKSSKINKNNSRRIPRATDHGPLIKRKNLKNDSILSLPAENSAQNETVLKSIYQLGRFFFEFGAKFVKELGLIPREHEDI